MNFGFYSCMSGMPWGGSEELWFRAARLLQRSGHQVSVNYKWWPGKAAQLTELESEGANVWLRNQPRSWLKTRQESWKRFVARNRTADSWLSQSQPDAVLITLGYHPDRVAVADECLSRRIPYAINVQCASSFFFIHSDRLEEYRRWYLGAERVFFVSGENQQKLENNLATRLDNARIVANPFNVDFDADPPWPNSSDPLRLACVGRVHFQSKGQDLIVDVMKQDKWKQRNIEITFYGHDQGQLTQLRQLIAMHGLENQLLVGGFVEDVESIWRDNHALLLPSRYEGAPLVVVEAMLCNRLGVVTDIGRNSELIEDGETGFVAAGPVVSLVDDAMERAWQQRDQWQRIGQLAGQRIRANYPRDPIREFADEIVAIAPGSSTV